MKNLIEIVVTFVGVSVVFYLTGSFAAWDMNPANWPEVLRWLIAMWALIISGMISAANYRR